VREQLVDSHLEKTRTNAIAFISSRHQKNRHFECAEFADDLTTNATRGERLCHIAGVNKRSVVSPTRNYQELRMTHVFTARATKERVFSLCTVEVNKRMERSN
jgi:hypothetical protein